MMDSHISSSGGGISDPNVKKAASPVPSCVSMKSDWSKDDPPNFSSGPVTSDLHAQKKPVKISKDKLESVFKELEHKIISLVKNELKRFKNLLSPDYPACTEKQVEDEEDQSSVREGALKITLHVLRNMNQTDLANTLQTKLAPACYRKLKSKLREKCQKINEGISQHGTTALLNEIYTELYITEGGSGEVNNEHEVRQIETASRRPATQETPIKCSDIFRPLPGQDKAIRTVLTKGVAGIGKTVSVQNFILDWSEGNVNQDVLFIFPLPFRELNLMKEKKLSLVQLLHCFFPETHELKPTHYTYYKILFIFDGLDECRLPLDFQNNDSVWDVTESTSVDVLLTNLIKGNLLPLALGKLAFQELDKGNLIFYEDDLRNSGIDVREMSVYSGMCTQIFREEFGLQLGKCSGQSLRESEWTSGPFPPLPSGSLTGVQSDSLTRSTDTDRKQLSQQRGNRQVHQGEDQGESLFREIHQSVPLSE
ncbi:uncharacterized protein LOC143493633 [Brachyhypopomus gauderio]|uniref:uncharacterized protein LOC143493633 n=1 Tax=Brachyhypopomus gauderio TaxID=698409 RepID=UPI0040429C2E